MSSDKTLDRLGWGCIICTVLAFGFGVITARAFIKAHLPEKPFTESSTPGESK